MRLAMRSLPKKMRPEQHKSAHFLFLPVFFPADSRSPPECAPHSKAIESLMHFWLRLFFRPSDLGAFVLVIIVLNGHSGGGVVGRFS